MGVAFGICCLPRSAYHLLYGADMTQTICANTRCKHYRACLNGKVAAARVDIDQPFTLHDGEYPDRMGLLVLDDGSKALVIDRLEN